MQGRGHNFMKLFQKIQISKDSLPPTVEESPKHFPRRQERWRGIKHIWIKHNIKHKTYLDEGESITDTDKNEETLYFWQFEDIGQKSGFSSTYLALNSSISSQLLSVIPICFWKTVLPPEMLTFSGLDFRIRFGIYLTAQNIPDIKKYTWQHKIYLIVENIPDSKKYTWQHKIYLTAHRTQHGCFGQTYMLKHIMSWVSVALAYFTFCWLIIFVAFQFQFELCCGPSWILDETLSFDMNCYDRSSFFFSCSTTTWKETNFEFCEAEWKFAFDIVTHNKNKIYIKLSKFNPILFL